MYIFSVVSDLVKKEHTLKDALLTVIPYYDDFEELQESKTFDDSDDYPVDPLIMDYIIDTQEIDKKFDFKSRNFDTQTSRFHFTKEFDDPKDATEFKTKLKDFLLQFVKEEVKILKNIFEKVRREIESKRDEFEADEVHFRFGDLRVTLVGKKDDVALKKRSIETTMDRISEEAKFVTLDLTIDDHNKLKFLNSINYFENIMRKFHGVQIHGMESSTGKLSILGTPEKTKDVKLKIFEDMAKISEIDVKTSVRQMDFLQRTQCKVVNDELKKRDAMLLLINGNKAKMITLKKCDDDEVRNSEFKHHYEVR